MASVRTGVCYNPFDLSLEVLGPMAMENHRDYVFNMYSEVMLDNVDTYMRAYLRQHKIRMTRVERDELVCYIAVELLKLPLEPVKLMLSDPDYLIRFMHSVCRNLWFWHCLLYFFLLLYFSNYVRKK